MSSANANIFDDESILEIRQVIQNGYEFTTIYREMNDEEEINEQIIVRECEPGENGYIAPQNRIQHSTGDLPDWYLNWRDDHSD